MFSSRLFILFILSGLVALPANGKPHKTPASNDFFSEFQQSVFQIRVIDNTSGKKSAIGSGFSLSADGLIATNYHVVSDVVIEPSRFRLEYVAPDGRTGPLKVLDIDVVHDLAVAASGSPTRSFLSFRKTALRKGSRIYSMGNPFDLGMTIVDGTYNGLVAESLYEKILFSGSLNPGMSGGPAMDSGGAVIGVNVSTAGNAISFLVPATYLQALLQTVRHNVSGSNPKFLQRIEQELYDNQEFYITKLLATDWKQDTLGSCLVPREMGGNFKCWGETPHDTDMLYTASYVNCSNSDDIYLASGFSTGSIEFNYRWFEAGSLGPGRFYRVLQKQFGSIEVPNEDAKQELDNPAAITRFVKLGGADWKTMLCSWRYKKYPRLHDVVLKMALVNRPAGSMIVELRLLGVSRESALAFCRKFMGALKCRN